VGLAAAATPAALRLADDLAATGADARARRVPVMLVFTETTCGYCTKAKLGHIAPLQASRDYGDKVIVREVDVAREASLRDFAGAPTTPAAFARRYKVRVVPTVVLVDAAGGALGEPLAGLMIEDFYQLYLERAVDTAHAVLRERRLKP